MRMFGREPHVTEALEVAEALTLPPAFTSLRLARAGEVEARTAEEAGAQGAGVLVWAEEAGRLAFAVTLEPDEPLVTARRAQYAGVWALAQALAALAAPEREVGIRWPDTIVYDGARIAGGTLLWPEGCAERATPEWLVFSAGAMVDRRLAEPGRFPGSTSIVEEALGSAGELIENFASYLMLGFDEWYSLGFERLAMRCLVRMPQAADRRVAENGDLVEAGARRALAEALAARAWFDPIRGVVRL